MLVRAGEGGCVGESRRGWLCIFPQCLSFSSVVEEGAGARVCRCRTASVADE